MSELEVRWSESDDDVTDIVRFFRENVDETYISHGELMDGRAESPDAWASDLDDVLEAEFAPLLGEEDDQEPRLLLVEILGEIIALAVVEFLPRARRPFGVVHDLVVHRDYRDRGIGSRMMHTLESEARKLGLGSLFLEVGATNDKAQDFFDRMGYAACSRTRVKNLGAGVPTDA